ncbi:hypothetical protein CFC21_058590 [Triticum aestivum]|uniref:PPPDE domain-containing protein n=3 Tax=Triticum TaxID=4564 RepID=A0A9R0TCU4_TRITD|nr:deSI-like protein At4g17486 [Triticum dicoccoides]XP_044370954.1 deSI-like protein At4g17486 [Triticum aestivum]KAF7050199.1 hypothetical protein CFC21_058590 [Triticum aestivum]VAI08749.1 unnamed protein product [Triticum turgidum subsp. durum]
MKLKTKRPGWKSLVPLQLSRKSTMRFFLFPKVQASGQSPNDTPVYLNVYDLTPMNGYIYWAGLGIFHSGIEVHGVEYAFGAHDYPTSGVFEVEPRQCPGFRFRRSIYLGTTCLDPIQVRQFMELQSVNYNGDSYHLIMKNCNHFCKDMCYKLTGSKIPKWVNRLARIGAICNCLLPESLKISPVGHDPNSQTEDSEKRRLRNPLSCFSSISSQRALPPSSSPFPPSPVKEPLASSSSRKSSTASLKSR